MPADVILEMRVKWGRNGIGERRIKPPKFGWIRIDSFLSLFSPRGTPKSHLRIGESCRKRTLSTRGIGPAKRWYCYRGLYSRVDRCDPDFYHYSAQIDGFVSQLFQESVENASPRPFLKPGAQNRYFFKGFQTKTDTFLDSACQPWAQVPPVLFVET